MLVSKASFKRQAKDENITPLAPSPGSSSAGDSTKKLTYRMSDAEREIIVRMTLDGKKPSEIGKALGIKAGTVSMFLRRKKLKAMSSIDSETAQLLTRDPSAKKFFEAKHYK